MGTVATIILILLGGGFVGGTNPFDPNPPSMESYGGEEDGGGDGEECIPEEPGGECEPGDGGGHVGTSG